MLVGLAPGAHGSNRTGRPFTGDASGDFLYPALYRAGFASQPEATSREDGLRLTRLPDHRCRALRAAAEQADAARAAQLLSLFSGRVRGALALARRRRPRRDRIRGDFARAARARFHARAGGLGLRPRRRGYGADRVSATVVAIASYHPSRQNTNTGKLTVPMFDAIFTRANELLGRDERAGRAATAPARRSARPSSSRAPT